MFGSTLIHMSLLFDVSIATMSLALTFESLGVLIGSVTCAFIASRLDYDCVTATTVLDGGLTTICAPLIYGFPGFVTSWAVRGVASGLFNPRENVFLIVLFSCFSVCFKFRFVNIAMGRYNVSHFRFIAICGE